MTQVDTNFPKVRRMLLNVSPFILECFQPASTLLHGHLALAKNQRTSRTFTSRVNVHVLCVESALGLGGHVVMGVEPLVARFHHADVIPSVEFFPSGCCSSCCSQTVLCDRQVNFICGKIIAHSCIVNTNHLRCCLYMMRITWANHSKRSILVSNVSRIEHIGLA